MRALLQVVPFFGAFVQTTKQQLANTTSLAFDAAAGLLQGDLAPAATLAAAQEAIFNTQTSPLPTLLTVRCVCLAAPLSMCAERRLTPRRIACAVSTYSSARKCR
jgi:hypothetical protein